MDTNKLAGRISSYLTFIFVLIAGLYLSFIVNASPKNQKNQATKIIPDESIYQSQINLEDQNGAKTGLNIFEGSPVIVSMFYGSCNYSCPVLFDTIKKTLKELPEEKMKLVKVLLVSFDPQKDTVSSLQKLAKNHELDLSRWKLMRTSEDEVAELAALLDIKYRKIKGGDFNHTPYLGLLNEQGVLIVSADNFGDGRAKIIEAVSKL